MREPNRYWKNRPVNRRPVRASAVKMPQAYYPCLGGVGDEADEKPVGESTDCMTCTSYARVSGMLGYWTRMIDRGRQAVFKFWEPREPVFMVP
jgi:hypothetical protein